MERAQCFALFISTVICSGTCRLLRGWSSVPPANALKDIADALQVSTDALLSDYQVSVKDKELQIIAHELSTPTYNIFNDQLYCGPTIWSRYKLLERPAQIKKGNITFKVPINGIQTNQLGKLIQSQGDFKIIWNQIIQDFSESKLTIRRIRPEELKSFWSIIFYDIEEPLLIVESNSHKIAMDFNANMQLIFLEEL
jgi:hypothetical protein